jgi:hypothetical protein
MRARSPAEVVAALRREAAVRSGVFRTERALRRAGRTAESLLLGPFLGEIGYELEYWIPFLRRQLRLHGITPEQATVMTRGGAALWYGDFAANALDILELIPPDRYLPKLEERRRRARDLKQLRVEAFDRELIALARERLGALTIVHPSLMFARLRGLWFKNRGLEELWPQVEYRRLDVLPEPVPGLPDRYVAVKAYFNECLPATAEIRHLLRESIERLAEENDVVLLSTGLLVDDHEEWATSHPRLHPIEHLLRPENNLAVQTRIIAAARGLVATYGGFSYLGPCLGVPTLAFYEVEQTVPVHLEVLRAAFPEARYARARAGDLSAITRFAGGLEADREPSRS